MTYLLHYTSADRPGDDSPWSVYSELYVHPEDNDPIEGTARLVSTHPTEAEADAEARRLQGITRWLPSCQDHSRAGERDKRRAVRFADSMARLKATVAGWGVTA